MEYAVGWRALEEFEVLLGWRSKHVWSSESVQSDKSLAKLTEEAQFLGRKFDDSDGEFVFCVAEGRRSAACRARVCPKGRLCEPLQRCAPIYVEEEFQGQRRWRCQAI